MSFILRDMNVADLEAVLRIEQEVQAQPWSQGSFIDALHAGYACNVLELNGAVLGYAVLMGGVDEAELLTLSIAPEQQRQGWGQRLLQAMLDLAQARNVARVLLEVRATNHAALALYQASGFRSIGVRRGYYASPNGREDALIMERSC
jgi:[ribosomal protein S18]-alanine N-acetyltransferase